MNDSFVLLIIVVAIIYTKCEVQTSTTKQTNVRRSLSSDSCKKKEYEVLVNVQTDDHPDDITWQIKEWETNKKKEKEAVAQGGPYEENIPNKLHQHSICLKTGVYSFSIQDKLGNGIEDVAGWYNLKLNGNIDMIEGNGNFGYQSAHKFGICEKDKDCEDDNGCATNICDTATNLCQFDNMQVEMRIELKTDKQPHQFEWNVTDMNTNEIVMNVPRGEYTKSSKTFKYEECLWNGAYKVSFGNKNFVHNPGYFRVYANNVLLKDIDGFATLYGKDTTVICMKNEDCDDKNDCTVDICHADKQCTNELLTTFSPSKNCRTVGSPKMLVLAVSALDSSFSTPLEQLSKNVFGTPDSTEVELNLKSQVSKCSANKLNIEPFEGHTTQGSEYIHNGVTSIQLNSYVTGEQAGKVVDDVITAARNKFGQDLEKQFDLLAVCLPPNTRIGTSSTWKGNAVVGGSLSVYNDVNCNYPSVLMHEIGHNFGLSHSNDQFYYGDETGMMGISYDSTDVPYKCYNGPKSWKLGWYYDSHQVINFNEVASAIMFFQLVGVVDYAIRGEFRMTILKIINSNDGNDYYITFNRKAGINKDTKEGTDEVLIAKCAAGYFYEDSVLLSTLVVGQSHFIVHSSNDYVVEIKVTDIHTSKAPAYADIVIQKASYSCVHDSECNDWNSCTIDACVLNASTGLSQCKYTPVACSSCGAMASLDVSTNKYPEHLQWTIKNINKNRVVAASGYYTEPFHFSTRSKCLEYGRYVFSFAFSKNNTELGLQYSLHIGSTTIDTDILSETAYIENIFVICKTDADCQDYNGCTFDRCNTDTHLCVHTEYPDNKCFNCTMFNLDLSLDSYPEETSWSLTAMTGRATEKLVTVLSGDPYPIREQGYGRSKAPTKSRGGRSKAPTRVGTHMKHFYGNNDPIRRRRLQITDQFAKSSCLENNHIYTFIIADSFGDGICCSQGDGSMAVSLSNHVVLSGGEFSRARSITFGLFGCTSDSQCDDRNKCTIDSCDTDINVCLHVHQSCSTCGEFVSVGMTTDSSPLGTSWTIQEVGTNQVVLKGGPYESSCSFYHKTQCLPHGSYVFSVFSNSDESIKDKDFIKTLKKEFKYGKFNRLSKTSRLFCHHSDEFYTLYVGKQQVVIEQEMDEKIQNVTFMV